MTASERLSSGIEFGQLPDTTEIGVQEGFDLFEADQLPLGLDEAPEQPVLVFRSPMSPPRTPYLGHAIPGRTR